MAFRGYGDINRTGNILRLSGMALIPYARGSGAAAQLLLYLLEEARSRGDSTMMLEVIDRSRAVAFYRRHGFREIGRLQGWRRPVTSDVLPGDATMEEIPTLRALQMEGVREYPEIPWQISRYALAKLEKTRAFQAKNARVVIGDPESPAIRVHGLFSSSSDWQDLRAALAGVLTLFPEREFFAPAIWPEDFGTKIFEPLGFRREPLRQFLMRQDL